MPNKPNTFGVVLIAAAAGAVAGMLLAPKRGIDTRDELKNKYNDMKNKTQDRAMTAKDKLDRGIEAARSKTHDVADKTKDIADEAARKSHKSADEAARKAAAGAHQHGILNHLCQCVTRHPLLWSCCPGTFGS